MIEMLVLALLLLLLGGVWKFFDLLSDVSHLKELTDTRLDYYRKDVERLQERVAKLEDHLLDRYDVDEADWWRHGVSAEDSDIFSAVEDDDGDDQELP